MRISEDTRYPHPVLGLSSGDFTSGEFDVQFTAREDMATGALSLSHEIKLTEAGIQDLVVRGQAACGVFVRCNDTYHTELKLLAWPKGVSDFGAGTLLNRVTLRPIIWLQEDLPVWNPGSIHPEFVPPVALSRGDIVAVADELILNVGRQKFASIESIFELDHSPDMAEGRIQVLLDRERITILVGPKTHQMLCVLRENAHGKSIVMNSVYLPAVMEVLDNLRESHDQYEGLRWYQPFIAKCDLKGIDVSSSLSILDSAQALLSEPTQLLSGLLSENDDVG